MNSLFKIVVTIAVVIAYSILGVFALQYLGADIKISFQSVAAFAFLYSMFGSSHFNDMVNRHIH